jgi:hypothetical protein
MFIALVDYLYLSGINCISVFLSHANCISLVDIQTLRAAGQMETSGQGVIRAGVVNWVGALRI